MVNQTNKFQVMFQLPCSIFILIKKLKKILEAFQKIQLLNFFVDWSITVGKVIFLKPLLSGA